MNKVLVINAGSSTIKWKLFTEEKLKVIAAGVADRIFVDGIIETEYQDQKHKREITLNSHQDASNEVVKDLQKLNIIANMDEIKYIGFRVVQGGTEFTKTTTITKEVLAKIASYAPLAPLHNPGAVQTINALKKIFPQAKLSATFDTAFHTTIAPVNHTYPIAHALTTKYQIKKYGFHGTSHHYITQELEKVLKKQKVSFVNLHIGNGASLCAIENSRSIDTSMGLTPLAGVMMGTRSGDIDPATHGYILKQTNMSIEEFDNILLKESGIKGVSGISQDLRDVQQAAKDGNKQALFALDLYAQKIADYLAIYLNKVKKPEAIVFTAGVGENAGAVRASIINKINILKLTIDQVANQKIQGNMQLISTVNSELPIYVIRTDEEYMIAKEALQL